MEIDSHRYSRNPFVAGIFSLILPGLGQVYNGQLVLGVFLACVSPLCPILLSGVAMGEFFRSDYMATIVILMSLFVVPYSFVQSVYRAWSAREYELKFYNHISVYLTFVIGAYFVLCSVLYFENVKRLIGYEVHKISSDEMAPALSESDYVLVWKNAFRDHAPKRGDMIAYSRKNQASTSEDESKIRLVGRVIGVPGDRVEIRETRVYVNGNKLSEQEYAQWSSKGLGEEFPEIEVPMGKLFVLVDNRDFRNSTGLVGDSRDYYEKFIDISRVWGKAQYVYLSIAHPERSGRKIY